MRIEKYKIMANDREALAYYMQMVEATADGTKTIVETDDYYELVDYEPPVEEAPRPTYEELVVQKIRLRYDLNSELSILRQRDVKTEEFEAYNSYCELCKAEAKEELGL